MQPTNLHSPPEKDDFKGVSEFNEDITKIPEFGYEDADPNSPEAVLARYPLLSAMTPEEREALNKKLKRRIDIWMLPMLTFMLFINYLDRTNVTNARIAGMQKDMGMTDVQWSAGISLFYVGYMISQLPGSMIISKYKPRVIMPAVMLMWSVPTICMPLATNAAGFTVCRFLVGLFEGPFFPGIALMTSSWYVKDELPFRMALWHAAIPLSSVFGGPLAAAVLETMDGVKGLHAWKWFLLIEGAVSIIVAVAAYWCLPNWPHNTEWLSPEESEMAQYRVVMSAGGIDENQEGMTIYKGAFIAAKDPFTWLFVILHFCLVVAQAYKDFLPSILRTMTKDKLTTYMLQAPAFFSGYIATLVFGWSAGKRKETTWHIIGPLVGSIAGILMIILAHPTAARYTGVCLLIIGTASGLNLHVSWETSIIPSPRHKKAAVIAIANMFSSTSHWFTPYFFLSNQEPYYRLGGGLLLFGCCISILAVGAIRWRVNKLNKAMDQREGSENVTRAETGLEPKAASWRFPH